MELYTVDAFTARPFSGNPAAVCMCVYPIEASLMQAIAREMNLSETAFLTKVEDGYRLRWFTPSAEVKLCGHATLASAHVLWETGRLGIGEEARFHTRSGILTATMAGGLVRLDFPAANPVPYEGDKEQIAAALKTELEQVKGVYQYSEDLLVELRSEMTVRGLNPDFEAVKSLPARGITVTSASKSDAYDLVSRFFAPRIGIAEDPVTGSAHCGLAPFWAERLGRTQLKAFQASARGGELELELSGGRVLIAGQAVTVVKGSLDVSYLASFR